MTPREMESVLESIVVLVDTREQPTERFKQRMNALECEYRRQCLKFGDYTAEYTIGGKSIFA